MSDWNDKNFVLTKMLEDPFTYNNASFELKKDEDIKLAAVCACGKNLYSFWLHGISFNEELSMIAISNYSFAIRYTTSEHRNSKRFMLHAVECDGMNLEYASCGLKKDEDVVQKAIFSDPRAIKFVSPEVKNYRKYVLIAVNFDGSLLKFTTDEMKDDEGIVLTAVKNSGYSLGYASDRLKGNKHIAWNAFLNNREALDYIADNIKYDQIFKMNFDSPNDLKFGWASASSI